MDAIKIKRMKSIDEFATEYAQDKYLPVQTSQAVKAGANYVLDEIETVLTTEFICWRVATDRLKLLEIHSRIKELKGE